MSNLNTAPSLHNEKMLNGYIETFYSSSHAFSNTINFIYIFLWGSAAQQPAGFSLLNDSGLWYGTRDPSDPILVILLYPLGIL